jgi:hypothetical protein
MSVQRKEVYLLVSVMKLGTSESESSAVPEQTCDRKECDARPASQVRHYGLSRRPQSFWLLASWYACSTEATVQQRSNRKGCVRLVDELWVGHYHEHLGRIVTRPTRWHFAGVEWSLSDRCGIDGGWGGTAGLRTRQRVDSRYKTATTWPNGETPTRCKTATTTKQFYFTPIQPRGDMNKHY